jgi:hypothetical protein
MIVAPKARFTLLRYGEKDGPFYGLSEPSAQSSRWTVYVCPKCRTETGFEWSDFGKHVGSRFSNLMYRDRQAVEREVPSRLTDQNAFVDFYWPGLQQCCSDLLPVRTTGRKGSTVSASN